MEYHSDSQICFQLRNWIDAGKNCPKAHPLSLKTFTMMHCGAYPASPGEPMRERDPEGQTDRRTGDLPRRVRDEVERQGTRLWGCS